MLFATTSVPEGRHASALRSARATGVFPTRDQLMYNTRIGVFVLALLGATVAGAAATRGEIAAVIDGRGILEKDVDMRAATQLRELNAKVFEIRERVLNDMINEQLLEEEARRLDQSVQQLLNDAVNSQVSAPTASEVDSYYLGIKDRIGRPLEDVRQDIANFLTETRRREAHERYLADLRSRAKVAVLLEPPRTDVSIDSRRVRGPTNAAITIAVFSDYECPYCGRAEQTLRQLTTKYPTQVRVAYRDFPLDFHPNAQLAAEGSRCALEQQKYWPYHALLFANQQRLKSEDLAKYAGQVGMDPRQFDECLAQKTYAADVARDMAEGRELGITGTPTFYVNGIAVTGALELQEFSRVIDGELMRIRGASKVAKQGKALR